MVLAGLDVAFFAIARTTGSGWLVVLLCGVTGALIVGTAAPALSLLRCRVSVSAPRDATVGGSLVVHLAVASGGQGTEVVVLDPPGEPVVANPPCAGDAVVVPARRGVFTAVAVECRSAAPLGLVAWARRIEVALSCAVEVAPRPIEMSLRESLHAGADGVEAITRGRIGHESVRSVRTYTPGDPIRSVHWASTARWGELMVKEMENPDAPEVVISVDLRGSAERDVEAAASRAAGLAIVALAGGLPVTLLTAERDGPRAGRVATVVEAGRRLARAVPGTPADGPIPNGAVVVRIAARA